MATKFARRVGNLEASSIFRINAKAQALKSKGRRIFRLDAGDPDFEAPGAIKAAGQRAFEQGYSHYTPIGGCPN